MIVFLIILVLVENDTRNFNVFHLSFIQALEKMALVEQDANGGRKLTSQGRRDMDRIAAQIAKV